MMVRHELDLVLAPNATLKKVSRPVTRFGPAVDGIANEMIRVMREHDGIGLAANQVGLTLRIIVADDRSGPRVLVNPIIVERSAEKVVGVEGCLSQPGIKCAVERYREIAVRYKDVRGLPAFLRTRDLLAMIIQHEIDHLEGRLLTDMGDIVEQG